jgi:hypothetical protein
MAPSFVKDLGVPENKAKFTFKKPESLEVIGSYVTRTMAMPNQTIDLAVQMPKVLLLFYLFIYFLLYSCFVNSITHWYLSIYYLYIVHVHMLVQSRLFVLMNFQFV